MKFFSFNFPLREYVFCTSPAPPPPISFLMVRPFAEVMSGSVELNETEVNIQE